MSDLSDPRVFFAAERTTLAWNRTALTLLAFGFAVERFGMFMAALEQKNPNVHGGPSFWFGLVFVLMACFFAFAAAAQYKLILKTLRPVEFPTHAIPNLAFSINLAIGALALVLAAYLMVAHLA